MTKDTRERREELPQAKVFANRLFSKLTYTQEEKKKLLELTDGLIEPGSTMSSLGAAVLSSWFEVDLLSAKSAAEYARLSVKITERYDITFSLQRVKDREMFVEEFGRLLHLLVFQSPSSSLR